MAKKNSMVLLVLSLLFMNSCSNPVVDGSRQNELNPGVSDQNSLVSTFVGFEQYDEGPALDIALGQGTDPGDFSMCATAETIYILDGKSFAIRKLDRASNKITTLVKGTGKSSGSLAETTGDWTEFYAPRGGIWYSGTKLYFGDGYGIRLLDLSNKKVSNFAGDVFSPGSLDGASNVARFYGIDAMVGNSTHLFVNDKYSIRSVELQSGLVKTLTVCTSSNGLWLDGVNLYFIENNNEVKTIPITAIKRTSTSMKTGLTDVRSIWGDATNWYVSHWQDNKISAINRSSKAVTTVAGSGQSAFTDGIGTAAAFTYPYRITGYGNELFVFDAGNAALRKVLISTKAVSTIAGARLKSSLVDGVGTKARIWPQDMWGKDNYLYIAEDRSTIRRIDLSSKAVVTWTGDSSVQTTTNGPLASARFSVVSRLWGDGTNLFVADGTVLRKIELGTGNVTTVAGVKGDSSSVDGDFSLTRFQGIRGLWGDGTYLYVLSGNTIRKVDFAQNKVSTLAGSASNSGSTDNDIGTSARFYNPEYLTGSGTTLYVSDNGSVIRSVDTVTGKTKTIAGLAGVRTTVDGICNEARFNVPSGLVVQGRRLLISVFYGGSIKSLNLDTMEVSNFAGVSGSYGMYNGTLSTSLFMNPVSLWLNAGTLYTGEYNGYRIRSMPLQ